MPTGYTAYVQDGATFEEFVWRCARNFGALVTMRHDPAGDPVPESFTPSTYHVDRIAEVERELAELEAMTSDGAKTRAAEDREAAKQRNAERMAKVAEIRRKYEAMLDQVRAWEPPSTDHENLKRFMIDQLRESIDFDCREYREPMPTLDGAVWLAEKRERGLRDLGYHHKEHGKELERVEQRNRWVRQLRESLAGVAA